MKKINVLNLGKSLNRLEMKSINGGTVEPTCKKACETASKNSDCCSGYTVSGNYPPCPNSGGARVCL